MKLRLPLKLLSALLSFYAISGFHVFAATEWDGSRYSGNIYTWVGSSSNDFHNGGIVLTNPNNKRKYTVLVVGSGLAGASAAATLAELGYNVKCFCYQDSPRRAHSIAAQGGINAAKNYQNDGDSVYRLFYDTVKGGDFRAREANVYRLAEVSSNIIDQCVAQGGRPVFPSAGHAVQWNFVPDAGAGYPVRFASGSV